MDIENVPGPLVMGARACILRNWRDDMGLAEAIDTARAATIISALNAGTSLAGALKLAALVVAVGSHMRAEIDELTRTPA